jgi:hypothetical protein
MKTFISIFVFILLITSGIQYWSGETDLGIYLLLLAIFNLIIVRRFEDEK